MPERRPLRFDRLDDAMADVDRLLPGYVSLGNWSLGQICNHLSDAIRASVEGIPFRAPWLVRTLLGPWAKRSVLRSGRMPDGMRLPEKFRPAPGLDARAEAEALRATIRAFAGAAGPFSIHPIMGPMTHEEWGRFHAIHAAHHLGFLVPEPSPSA